MGFLSRAWARGGVRAGALCVVLLAVYAGSLSNHFLNYDDPWLIERNPVLEQPAGEALGSILFKLDRETRLTLGAEYLPLRDLSLWLEVQLFGKSAFALRVAQLLLYMAAALAFRGALVRCFGTGPGELAAWLFALHPVHVESVAWLAGRKDVLALVFLGLALWRHALGVRDARFSVPLLWLAACLSKAMAVSFVGPLLATDLWLRRRPDPVRYGLSALLVGGALAVHVYVGSLVHMVGGPLAGDRLDAFISMGPVWLRYVAMCLSPAQLSVRHDVTVLQHWTPTAALGWALLVGSGAAALWALRRDVRLPFVAWLWFAVPLGPVSQVLVPLQNVVADRYLWLSVMGPLLLLAHLDRAVRGRLAQPLGVALAVLLGAATAVRAPLFADSVALFVDATVKTRRDPVAPYQLGKALEAAGREEDAMRAFGIAIDRCETSDGVLFRASNNLAKLLAARGRLRAARRVLEEALVHRPDAPKLRRNLDKVLKLLGQSTEKALDDSPAP